MVSWAEKYLALKGILDREISAQEWFLGKVLSLGKVSWAEKFLLGYGFWEGLSRMLRLLGLSRDQSKFVTKRTDCKIRKLFTEPAKM